MSAYGKVELSKERYEWNPTPLPEQVVLVTSIDAEGRPHVATKSRVSVMSYGPPTIVAFACRADYMTATNVKKTKSFVINVPGDDLVATSWVVGSHPTLHGPELFNEFGLTPIPGIAEGAPRIAECRAHLECALEDTRRFGDDLVVFGKVVSVSMDEEIAQGATVHRYQKLAPFFFLDADVTGSLGLARQVEEPVFGPSHDITILATRDIHKAAEFYSKVFEWPVRVENQAYVEFEMRGGRGLAVCRREAMARYVNEDLFEVPPGRLGPVEIYLRTDDLPHTIARLVSVGARELSELREREWGEHAAYFADPDGHILVIAGQLSRRDRERL